MQKIILSNGKEFPILFDLNVMEQVQKRYGNVSALSAKLHEFGEMKWIMSTLINEGMEYNSYMSNMPVKPITPEQVGVLFTIADFRDGKISQAVIDAFNESLGGEKNLSAEDLTTIANSMQEAAEATI